MRNPMVSRTLMFALLTHLWLGSVCFAGDASIYISLDTGKYVVKTEGLGISKERQRLLEQAIKDNFMSVDLILSGNIELKLNDQEVRRLQVRINRIEPKNRRKFEDETEEILDELMEEGFSRKGHSAGFFDKVAIGQNVEVRQGEKLDELVIIGGTADIHGTVKSLVAIGSQVHLFPTAKITGNMVALGSNVQKDKGAKVEADQINLTIPFPLPFDGIVGSFGDFSFMSWPLAILLGFGWLLLMLGLAVLYTKLFPEIHRQTTENVTALLLESFGWGLLSMFLVFPLAFVLMLTIIGIPLIPLYFSLVGLFVFAGYVAACQFVGQKLPIKSKPWGVMTLFLGMILLKVIGIIPILGCIVVLLAATTGFGGLVKVLTTKAKKRKRSSTA